jgi:hypothetical protein
MLYILPYKTVHLLWHWGLSTMMDLWCCSLLKYPDLAHQRIADFYLASGGSAHFFISKKFCERMSVSREINFDF